MIYRHRVSLNRANKFKKPGLVKAGLLLLLTIICLTSAGGTPPALAASSVSMKAETGLAGYARSGQYIPLRVILDNRGKAVSGRLEVKAIGGDSTVVYQRHLSLPGGALKRVNMYLPRSNNNPYSVEFLSGDKKLATAKLRLTICPPSEVLAGLLAADPAALKSLENVKFPGQGQHLTTVSLKAEDIPEQALCLNSLDILVLDNFSVRSLSRQQIKAIKDWTFNGGLLVVAGGPAWQKTTDGLPSSLLPVQLDGSSQISSLAGIDKLAGAGLPAQGMVLSKGKVTAGAILLKSGDIPAIVQRKAGSGDVIYTAFDLAQAPFDKWAGMPALWSGLLYRTDPHHIISSGAVQQEDYSYNNITWNLRNFPDVGLPSTKSLAIVLVLYVLVLGPGIYLFLKKFDRRDLGWIAIPLLALILFSATYAVAFKGKDRDVFINIVSLLNMQEEGQGGHLSSYVGLFAPTKTHYQISLPEEQIINVGSNGENNVRRIYGPYGPISGPNNEEDVIARIELSDQPRVSYGEATRWSLRSLQTERILDNCGRIDGKIICSGGRLKGTITNNTGYLLTGAVLFNEYCRQRVGSLRPGQSVEVDITPRSVYWGNGRMSWVAANYPVYWPRNMQNRMNRIDQLTSNLMEMAYNRKELAQAPLMLMAYSPGAPRAKIINDVKGNTYYSTVIIAPLQPIAVNAGRAELLPGMIKGYVTGFSGRNMYSDMWGVQIDGGMVTYQLNLPFSSQGLQVEDLKILVETGDYVQAQNLKIKVLNQLTGQWEDFRYNPQGILLVKGGCYIAKDDGVLVQVGTDTNIQINGVSMSLQGKYPSGQAAELNGGGI